MSKTGYKIRKRATYNAILLHPLFWAVLRWLVSQSYPKKDEQADGPG